MTSRTCESAASCFAQPPLASPRRIFSTPVSFPCAWSRRHLSLRAARALRHRESQRVERAGFGLRHGRLRAHHSAYTPLPKRGIALSFSIVKSFKQFRALPNWFVLNRLCGCSASRARLGTKAHFGEGGLTAECSQSLAYSGVLTLFEVLGPGTTPSRLTVRGNLKSA